MIAIAGTVDFVDADDRDACVAAVAPYQRSTREDEPGCLAYSFSADALVSTRIQVFELWVDDDALAAHFTHPNFAAMRRVLAGFRRNGTALDKLCVEAVESLAGAPA